MSTCTRIHHKHIHTHMLLHTRKHHIHIHMHKYTYTYTSHAHTRKHIHTRHTEYIHTNGASIIRCGQPHAGVSGSRSSDDEAMIRAMVKYSPRGQWVPVHAARVCMSTYVRALYIYIFACYVYIRLRACACYMYTRADMDLQDVCCLETRVSLWCHSAVTYIRCYVFDCKMTIGDTGFVMMSLCSHIHNAWNHIHNNNSRHFAVTDNTTMYYIQIDSSYLCITHRLIVHIYVLHTDW